MREGPRHATTAAVRSAIARRCRHRRSALTSGREALLIGRITRPVGPTPSDCRDATRWPLFAAADSSTRATIDTFAHADRCVSHFGLAAIRRPVVVGIERTDQTTNRMSTTRAGRRSSCRHRRVEQQHRPSPPPHLPHDDVCCVFVGCCNRCWDRLWPGIKSIKQTVYSLSLSSHIIAADNNNQRATELINELCVNYSKTNGCRCIVNSALVRAGRVCVSVCVSGCIRTQ